MSTEDPKSPAPAGTGGPEGAAAAGTTSAPRPVGFEWGGQVRGLAMLLGGQLVAGTLLGLILYFLTVLSGVYIPLLGAVLIGWLMSLLAADSVKRAGFDNFLVGALCVTLGAVFAFGAFHVGRYMDFLHQLDATVDASYDGELQKIVRNRVVIPPDASPDEIQRVRMAFVERMNKEQHDKGDTNYDYRTWLRGEMRQTILESEEYKGIGNDSFFGGYLTLEMKKGLELRIGARSKGYDLGAAGIIAYRISEILLTAVVGMWPLVALLLLLPRTKHSQNRLPHTLPLVFLSPDDPIRLAQQVASGGVAQIDKGQAVLHGNFPAVSLSVRTPDKAVGVDKLAEAGEPEVVLELSWVDKTVKGDLRHRSYGKWWYPTSVLETITRKFGPPPVLPEPGEEAGAADADTSGKKKKK
ncbi:MAG: hypothetical protein AB7K09_03940 [Planctomycetota bacterium]